jgi:hypothetical protein
MMMTDFERRLAPFTPDWLESPEFDEAGKVHDWRNHVGGRTKGLWSTFTQEQRLAIALDADDDAGNEDWD